MVPPAALYLSSKLYDEQNIMLQIQIECVNLNVF